MDIWEEGEEVVLRFGRYEADLRALLPGVHHVAGEAVAAPEPSDILVLQAFAAGDDAQIGFARGIEHEGRLARFQLFPASHRWDDVQHQVIRRDREVVHHAVVRDLEPFLVHQLALGIDLVIGDIVRVHAAGRVADGDHVACVRVDLGVGGEGLAGHRAAEVLVAPRFHGRRVHHQRGAVFLQGPQLAAVQPGVGVGGAAVFALHAFIVGQRIAIGAEQGLACLVFQLPLVGLRPALAEIALTVVKVKAGDHSVAVEGDVVSQARRKLGIGLHAKEGAIQFWRNLAFVLQVGDIRLDPAGLVETGVIRCVGKLRHVEPLLADDCMLY